MSGEPTFVNQSRRWILALLLITSGFVFLFLAWICFWPWPAPQREEIPWEPDAIVVLGSGDLVRVREAARMAERFPKAPVIITGDSGFLEKGLLERGVPQERFVIEPDAESTYENAALLVPIFEEHEVERFVLVTNWFHVPRSEAVFRNRFPRVAFVSTWEAASDPLPPWDRHSQRREKLAALYYWIRYGVWSF
jgi:uncharacterized SAM-binding protein YcdF (DUF218 family)